MCLFSLPDRSEQEQNEAFPKNHMITDNHIVDIIEWQCQRAVFTFNFIFNCVWQGEHEKR